MSILNDLIAMCPEERQKTHYLFICTTYDMAYSTFQSAQKMQGAFRHRLTIGFVSKEATELPVSMDSYHMVIGTPGEVFTLIENQDNQFTNCVFDDADGYMSWQKMRTVFQKTRNAVYTVLSSHRIADIDRMDLGNYELFQRTFNFDNSDRLHLSQMSSSSTGLNSFDRKMKMLNVLLRAVADICPMGQILVYCFVSLRNSSNAQTFDVHEQLFTSIFLLIESRRGRKGR